MNFGRIKQITQYKEVNDVLYALCEGITKILESKIIGIYLFGSLTYDDFNPKRSDIDLLVVTKENLTNEELELVKNFHFQIEKDYKEWKERIECSYTPLVMFKNKEPIDLHRPYFGGGIFYPNATYGNEWLINNYLVYNHGITLIGSEFKTLVDPIAIVDVQKASIRDLFKEWEPKITDHEWLQNSHYQSYLVLNLCRILHTVLNGEASSKSVSSAWVKKQFPQWTNLIRTAEDWEYGKKMDLVEDTIAFIKFTIEKVKESKIKAILFDFSRVLLNAKDSNYPDSLNALYKRVSQIENFNSLEHFAFNKELLEFAADIKDQYDLYIFTTGTIQNDVHLKSFIDHIFNRIFTVEEVGFSKVNKEAYEFITNQLSLQPEEVLFIDDSEENIRAASEAGLQTIHFETTEKTVNAIKSYLSIVCG